MNTVEQFHGQSAKALERDTFSLQERVWQGVLEAKLEKNYVPDRVRQKLVFDRINWETFAEEIAAEAKGSSEGVGKQLRGKVFELLVAADPEFGQRSPLEKELLVLAHNPDAFGLGKELGVYRNPDMAFLLVEKEDLPAQAGGVVIEGVGESKLGLLNERSFKQLSETGFATGVKALVEVVNRLPDPASHGLIEVAKAREHHQTKPVLTISPEFSQLLIVPANRTIQWSSTLINRKEFSAEGRNKFYTLLNDTRHVRTVRAAFSIAEVVGITKKVRSGIIL